MAVREAWGCEEERSWAAGTQVPPLTREQVVATPEPRPGYRFQWPRGPRVRGLGGMAWRDPPSRLAVTPVRLRSPPKVTRDIRRWPTSRSLRRGDNVGVGNPQVQQELRRAARLGRFKFR